VKVFEFFSLREILAKEDLVLNNQVFMIIENNNNQDLNKDQKSNPKKNSQYYKIIKQNITMIGRQCVLLQIIDISNKIHYDQAIADKQFIELINATVSHEMRNPINSIIY
jgi:signal transduction histidine kinase